MKLDGEVRAGQEGLRRVPRLLLALRRAGQHHVADLQPAALREAEQQPAGADLDVVGMRAEGEHGQRPPAGALRRQRQHDMRRYTAAVAPAAVMAPLFAPERSGSQIIHGQLPRWYISSSWARSLTVSAGDQ